MTLTAHPEATAAQREVYQEARMRNASMNPEGRQPRGGYQGKNKNDAKGQGKPGGKERRDQRGKGKNDGKKKDANPESWEKRGWVRKGAKGTSKKKRRLPWALIRWRRGLKPLNQSWKRQERPNWKEAMKGDWHWPLLLQTNFNFLAVLVGPSPKPMRALQSLCMEARMTFLARIPLERRLMQLRQMVQLWPMLRPWRLFPNRPNATKKRVRLSFWRENGWSNVVAFCFKKSLKFYLFAASTWVGKVPSLYFLYLLLGLF